MLPLVLPVLDNVEITKLENLKPFMKNVNCRVIILKKGLKGFVYHNSHFSLFSGRISNEGRTPCYSGKSS